MAYQEDELTGVDLDVDILERGLVRLRRVDLGHVLHHDHRVDARLARHLLARFLHRREYLREVGTLKRGVEGRDLMGLVGGYLGFRGRHGIRDLRQLGA